MDTMRLAGIGVVFKHAGAAGRVFASVLLC